MSFNVALKCFSNNEHYNADFEYALIRLTPELVTSIQYRRTLFMAAYDQDQALSNMEFYSSYHAEYFCFSDPDSWWEKNGEPAICPWVDGIANCGETVQDIPDSFKLGEIQADPFYYECGRMSVSQHGIGWLCSPKHSGIEIETALLSWDEIEHILEKTEEGPNAE